MSDSNNWYAFFRGVSWPVDSLEFRNSHVAGLGTMFNWKVVIRKNFAIKLARMKCMYI